MCARKEVLIDFPCRKMSDSAFKSYPYFVRLCSLTSQLVVQEDDHYLLSWRGHTALSIISWS